MTSEDPTPTADDDFPEFAEPPRHRPPPEPEGRPGDDEAVESSQDEVDDVIARLRRERAEGER